MGLFDKFRKKKNNAEKVDERAEHTEQEPIEEQSENVAEETVPETPSDEVTVTDEN